MRWNLRLAAANRGIWQASDMQRLLAERGLVVSLGKMSHLWSGQPASIKLADLDVICAVLGCGVDELLIPEPDTVAQPKQDTAADAGRGECATGCGPAPPGRTLAPAALAGGSPPWHHRPFGDQLRRLPGLGSDLRAGCVHGLFQL